MKTKHADPDLAEGRKEGMENTLKFPIPRVQILKGTPSCHGTYLRNNGAWERCLNRFIDLLSHSLNHWIKNYIIHSYKVWGFDVCTKALFFKRPLNIRIILSINTLTTTTIAHNSVLQTLGKICSPYVYKNWADGKQFAKFSVRFPISHTFLFQYFEFGSHNFS